MSARIRPRRVGDLLRAELAAIISREIQDPRVELISVNSVDMSNDLQHAKIFVSSVDPATDMSSVVRVLHKARGFVRMQLARRRLGLRHIPELHFVHDESAARGRRIDEILGELQEDEGMSE